MKTLKQLREEYDSKIMPLVYANETVLEEIGNKRKKELGDYKPKAHDVPSSITMPNLLMFRRITYRRYPDNQTVALYYSKSVDKYLSIPFGPTGNLNLSEASVYDTLEELELNEGAKWEAIKGGLKGAAHGAAKGFFKGNAVAAEPGMAIGAVVGGVHGAYKGAKNAYKKAKESGIDEDWQSVNRKDKTDGLSQAAVNAYRRENPGSKLKTAVTEKNPTGKRAARRKSFCSRMGGMKKRLTSAKTARDPDSRINKALRRWNCEESFKAKLYEKRMQQEGVADYLDAGAEAIVPYYSAGKKVYKGDYSGAAKDAAVDTALLATGAVAGKVLGAGARLAGKGISKLTSKFGKGATKVPRDPSAIAKSAKKAPEAKSPKGSKGFSKTDALSAISNLAGGGDQSQSSDGKVATKISTDNVRKTQAKTYSPAMNNREDPINKSRKDTLVRKEYENSKKQVTENRITDLRDMLNEGFDRKDLIINGRTVTLNTSMAKRIVEVYDSVNTKNKKVVESMLNEDLESFKKLLNFSIKA